MGAGIARAVATFLCIVLVSNTTTALAQLAGTLSPSQAAANSARVQAVFEQYKASGRRTPAAEEQLIQVLNLRLPRTEANSTAIRDLLASPSASNEKSMLIRLLAAQYESTNPSPKNDLIIQI
jgi:predicted Zn-dependent protease